jgi:hypothetical protein
LPLLGSSPVTGKQLHDLHDFLLRVDFYVDIDFTRFYTLLFKMEGLWRLQRRRPFSFFGVLFFGLKHYFFIALWRLMLLF